MRLNNFRYKNGLWWLVFLCALWVFSSAYQLLLPTSNSYFLSGSLQDWDKKGHVIEKHVGKNDDFLRRRLQYEDISAASTFNTMSEAEESVIMVLKQRAPLVQEWLAAQRSNCKAFYAPSERPVGRVLKREWSKPRAGNQVRIVLMRDKMENRLFSLLTAYPEYK